MRAYPHRSLKKYVHMKVEEVGSRQGLRKKVRTREDIPGRSWRKHGEELRTDSDRDSVAWIRVRTAPVPPRRVSRRTRG